MGLVCHNHCFWHNYQANNKEVLKASATRTTLRTTDGMVYFSSHQSSIYWNNSSMHWNEIFNLLRCKTEPILEAVTGIDTIKYHTWPRIPMGKWQTHRRHHKREPRGQPFPSRWPRSTYKQTRTKHSKHKTEQKHKRSTKEVPPWNGQ